MVISEGAPNKIWPRVEQAEPLYDLPLEWESGWKKVRIEKAYLEKERESFDFDSNEKRPKAALLFKKIIKSY